MFIYYLWHRCCFKSCNLPATAVNRKGGPSYTHCNGEISNILQLKIEVRQTLGILAKNGAA